MLRGVIRERTRRRGFRLLANEFARRIARPILRNWVVSSAPLILTDGGLALSEPKTVGAQGSTKVLAASSLGSCLVFVSSAVVTVALAAIGRDMRLSPLDLQWVMNAELLPLAALTLVAGALGDRFGQKRIFLAGIALYGLGATAIGFALSFAPLVVGRFLQGLGGALILPNGQSSTFRVRIILHRNVASRLDPDKPRFGESGVPIAQRSQLSGSRLRRYLYGSHSLDNAVKLYEQYGREAKKRRRL